YNSISEAIETHVWPGLFHRRGLFRWAAYYGYDEGSPLRDDGKPVPYARHVGCAGRGASLEEADGGVQVLHHALEQIDEEMIDTGQGGNGRVVVVLEKPGEPDAAPRRVHYFRYGTSGFALALAEGGHEEDRRRLFNGIGRLIDTRISLGGGHYFRWTWK